MVGVVSSIPIGGNFITTRIRRMGEGTVFSLFVSPHLDGGGYPSQVWMVGGGYPGQVLMVGGSQPGLDGGRVPWAGLDGGGYPSQI